MLARHDDIDRYIQSVLLTVNKGSGRVYEQTYNLWKDWCHNAGVSPVDLHPSNVMQFLISQRVTRSTRQRQLSLMRKLLNVVVLVSGTAESRVAYELLKMAKIPLENLSTNERNLKALNPTETNEVIAYWNSIDNPIHIRNRALIALLVSTGLRRAEAVALEWRDIDLVNGKILVRHGKRNKSREAAIVGDYAIEYLEYWREINLGRYVFRPLDTTGQLGVDEQMSTDNAYRIIRQTQDATGVKISPHDARRTLATELLAQGASVADVQAQLGHTSPSTTLRYAKGVDAIERRKRFKTRYGV